MDHSSECPLSEVPLYNTCPCYINTYLETPYVFCLSSPQLSWSSAAAELSDRRKFRSNYRLAPSEKIHSPGLAALLQHYQWQQIAMLTQLESLFIEVHTLRHCSSDVPEGVV